jgi:anti-sigma factor RsiW
MTDYLDNNLSQIEKTAFAAHLQKCESCSEELRRQQHWLQHLSDINDSDADLSEQDRARMQEQIMMTIRSNEQAVRAAGYINQYKKTLKIS